MAGECPTLEILGNAQRQLFFVVQILEPTFPLYLSEALQNTNLTSPAAKLYLNDILIPQIPVLRTAAANSEVGHLVLGANNNASSLGGSSAY